MTQLKESLKQRIGSAKENLVITDVIEQFIDIDITDDVDKLRQHTVYLC